MGPHIVTESDRYGQVRVGLRDGPLSIPVVLKLWLGTHWVLGACLVGPYHENVWEPLVYMMYLAAGKERSGRRTGHDECAFL